MITNDSGSKKCDYYDFVKLTLFTVCREFQRDVFRLTIEKVCLSRQLQFIKFPSFSVAHKVVLTFLTVILSIFRSLKPLFTTELRPYLYVVLFLIIIHQVCQVWLMLFYLLS